MKLRRQGLQWRFLLCVLVTAVLFSVVAGFFAYDLGKRRAEESARQTVASLQAAVEKTAAIAVYAHDALLMHEVVVGVARNPLVLRAVIVDTAGHLLQTSGERMSTADPLPVQRRLQSPFDASETLGLLRIDIDAEQLRQLAGREATTFAALMVAQSALIALVIFLAGTRLVSRPIVVLAHQLAAMQPGTERRLDMPQGHGEDEIGALVRSANELLCTNAQTLQRERMLRHEVEAMEAQYRQIFDSTSAGIFVLDRQGRLINGNPTVMKVIGRGMSDLRQLRGQDFVGRVFARPERVKSMIDEAARRGETLSADLELKSPDGQIRWAHCLVSVQETQAGSAAHEVAGGSIVEGVLYDITERKRAEHDVRRRAELDALTGALNRAATEEAIDRFLAQAKSRDSMTLLYLDLDGFKQVNDLHGHVAGDEVLRQTTRRVTAELRRACDFIGRIGGDEFLVVLQHRAPSDLAAARIAARVLNRLREPIELDGGAQVGIGVSIGVASFPRHGGSRRELMHAADEAMYAVKRHGKNAYASAVIGPDARLQTVQPRLATRAGDDSGGHPTSREFHLSGY